jgi:hypothetical protein
VKGGRDTRKKAERLAWCEERALRYLARAAAAMTEPNPDNKAWAIVWTGMAMLRLAESDPDQAAVDRAEKIIKAMTVE